MNFIAENIQTLLNCGFLAVGLLLVFVPICKHVGIVDKPDKRKVHVGNIPLIGGFCIFLTSLIAVTYAQSFGYLSLLILGTGSLIMLVGIVDDLADVDPKIRLLLQFLITAATAHFFGLQITTLGTLFGLPLSLNLGIFSLPFTVVVVVGVTNAFNMIDGCDGLAGSLSLLAICAIAFLGVQPPEPEMSLLMLSLCAGLLVFLCFNIPAVFTFKVFLGDSGSLFLGYAISWMLIYSFERVKSIEPSFALWIVLIPVFDFLYVFITRLKVGRSIIQGDRSHLHHCLISLGFTHQKTTALIFMMSLLLLMLGLFFERVYPSLGLPIIGLLFILYFYGRICVADKTSTS